MKEESAIKFGNKTNLRRAAVDPKSTGEDNKLQADDLQYLIYLNCSLFSILIFYKKSTEDPFFNQMNHSI